MFSVVARKDGATIQATVVWPTAGACGVDLPGRTTSWSVRICSLAWKAISLASSTVKSSILPGRRRMRRRRIRGDEEKNQSIKSRQPGRLLVDAREDVVGRAGQA